MIRIERGDEPAALKAKRRAKLPKLRAKIAGGKATKDSDFAGYDVVKEELWSGQRFKCCFCESLEQAKRNDVEHFRPKGRANRDPGSRESYGYWWLTWTWENLFFACRNCNQAPYKLDKFPLDSAEILQPEDAPPGEEEALLIHPYEDATEHIQFRQDNAGQWLPVARNGSRRGLETIRVCGLNRSELVTMYTEHVTEVVAPLAKDVCKAEAPDEIRRAWSRACRSLLSPGRQYLALSFDALMVLVPTPVRQKHDLTVKPPGLSTT